MDARLLDRLQILLLSLLLLMVAIALRPLLPVDETRYLSVAWEMWQRGDYLVPYLNGIPYAHKPPLLFWLIQAGWWLFGVNDFWPRLLGMLLALLSLWPLTRLAQALWPGQSSDRYAIWLLFTSWPFLLFFTLVQFDLLLLLFTLMGMLGWWRMAGSGRFHWLPGIAIGLGILAKGPVILLHLLPVALLIPLWGIDTGGLKRWYRQIALSVLIGAVIGLAWAIPAAISGGEAYRNDIFWGQTAHRVVNSFAHKQPWWWYLAILPLMFFPWLLWRDLWRSLKAHFERTDPAVRFLLAWVVPVIIGFSLVSGKQLKYLLPILPAVALLAAQPLSHLANRPSRPLLAAGLLMFFGVLLVALPWVHLTHPPAWLGQVESRWGILPVLSGVGLLWLKPESPLQRLKWLMASGVLLMVALHLSMQFAVQAFDLKPLSLKIAAVQDTGSEVGITRKYHAQFNFLGRLKKPVIQLVYQPRGEVKLWAKDHPQEYLVIHRSDWPGLGEGAEYEQDYRNKPRELGLWRVDRWLAALSD